jgi:3-deoxy-D-manno-octulosonic acid (KDO) 8-phosphate synthase
MPQLGQGMPVNLKKGQVHSPWVKPTLEKIKKAGIDEATPKIVQRFFRSCGFKI